jgi:L-alanine-DL-glutamate epimerase-like enolase superfamily enzyme
MKIIKITPIVCDGGWWPWVFAKVETDEGLVGWGECSDNRALPRGVAGCIQDVEQILLGEDPRAVEKLHWIMYRMTQQNIGGVAQKAIAGIETALWDIKAKALNIPVYDLLGGPLREKIKVYWSHIGTYRARYQQLLGTPPIKSYDDIAYLGREAVKRGFDAIKTDLVIPGEPARTLRTEDGVISNDIIQKIVLLIKTLRESVGEQVDIALDLNYNFNTQGCIALAHAMQPYNLMWLEIDTIDSGALLQIKEQGKIPICSGENLYLMQGYKSFLEKHCMDICMIDVPWNSFIEGRRIAAFANMHDTNIAPHNYYSHVSTFMSAHFSACIPNFQIMEVDIDSAPWRDDIVDIVPEIKDGYMILPKKPGLGIEINEKEIAKYPWPSEMSTRLRFI